VLGTLLVDRVACRLVVVAGARGYAFTGDGTFGGLAASTWPTTFGGPNGIRTRVWSRSRMRQQSRIVLGGGHCSTATRLTADFADPFRRAATIIDKIPKRAKPADLPVEQPTKSELVINPKTANALGLTISPSLLQRADEIIQ